MIKCDKKERVHLQHFVLTGCLSKLAVDVSMLKFRKRSKTIKHFAAWLHGLLNYLAKKELFNLILYYTINFVYIYPEYLISFHSIPFSLLSIAENFCLFPFKQKNKSIERNNFKFNGSKSDNKNERVITLDHYHNMDKSIFLWCSAHLIDIWTPCHFDWEHKWPGENP